MSKSHNRKLRDIRSRKPNDAKRKNPNRGKHGCSRLHQLKTKEQTQEHGSRTITSMLSNNNDNTSVGKPGFFSALKSKVLSFRR